jgi:autotransporter-associated beta strand protein
VVVQNSVNTYSFEGGPLAGASSLTKTGGGTLVLANANTYKGSTTVSGGILAVNGTSLEDTSALVIDGGMVEIAGTETVDALYYGNSRQPAGTYGSGTSDATFKDNTRFSGSGMLMVGNGPEPDYTSWAAKNAPTGTAADDYDGDGVENGVEYALGGHAGINDCTRLPVLALNEGSMVFSFSCVHGAAATLAIEVGNNLNSWADSYTVGSSPEVEVSDNGDGTDFVSLTLPRAPGGLLFLRLKVSVD